MCLHLRLPFSPTLSMRASPHSVSCVCLETWFLAVRMVDNARYSKKCSCKISTNCFVLGWAAAVEDCFCSSRTSLVSTGAIKSQFDTQVLVKFAKLCFPFLLKSA